MVTSTLQTLRKKLALKRELSRLSSLARRVRDERLTYLSPAKLNRIEGTLNGLMQKNVRGDFLEFGVALGGSAIVIAQKARSVNRAFHGFDVFGMIPPPTSEKDDEKSKQRYEIIASGQSGGLGGDLYYGYRENLYEVVAKSFERYGLSVDGTNVALHKGLFEDTIHATAGLQVAFAHIDCDWYDPVALCLRHVGPLVSQGGAIVMDDYHDYGGCRTAVDEFLTAHPGWVMENGATVILRRGPAT